MTTTLLEAARKVLDHDVEGFTELSQAVDAAEAAGVKPLYLCMMQGDDEAEPRLRAWTAHRIRAQQLQNDGLPMVPYYAQPDIHRIASAAPEEGMEIEDASEIVFLDATGDQHRIVYDICEDRPGLGSGWFLHEDDPFALPADLGKAAPDAWPDDKLAAWASNWHCNDCATNPVDPTIYFRDMRMLKAFRAALRASAAPEEGGIPERETWWLIEREGCGLYTTSRSSLPGWSADPWRAARYTTALEANNARLMMQSLRDESTVTEHIFINKMPNALPSDSGKAAPEWHRDLIDREPDHGQYAKGGNANAALSDDDYVATLERIAEIIRDETRTTNSGVVHNSTDVARMILERTVRAATIVVAPPGWKLVPIEPTNEQLQAAGVTRVGYKAALRCAPSPPGVLDGGPK